MKSIGAKRARRFGIAAGTLLVAMVGSISTLISKPAAAQDDSTSVQMIIESLRTKVEDVSSWEADYVQNMNMMGMNIRTSGHMISKGRMSHMSMEMAMNSSDPQMQSQLGAMGSGMKMEVVVDANGVAWTQMDMMGTPMVMKMDVGAMGGQAGGAGQIPGGMSGLGGGGMAQNPVEMLEALREISSELRLNGTEIIGGVEVYEIESVLDPVQMQNFDATGAFSQMAAGESRMTFWIGTEDGFMRKMAIDGGASGMAMEMEFSELVLNPEVSDETFAYTPPPGVQVMDMSGMMDGGAMQGGGFPQGGGGNMGSPPPSAPVAQPQYNTKLRVGDRAPEFTGRTIDGQELSLSSLRGKVVLVDFWATWCQPCIRELPNVIEVYNKYKAKGFEIVGVNLDGSAVDEVKRGVNLDHSADEVKRFMRKAPEMSWPQLFDGQGFNGSIPQLYGVEAIPYAVLIDGEGTIQAVSLRGDALDRAVFKMFVD